MATKVFKKDAIICREGESTDIMYFILSGKVSVFKTVNGEKLSLSEFTKGKFVGEMSLFLNEPRTANVQALEETKMRTFTREEILFEFQQKPKVAYKMITELMERLKGAHGVISDLEGVKKSYEIMYKHKGRA